MKRPFRVRFARPSNIKLSEQAGGHDEALTCPKRPRSTSIGQGDQKQHSKSRLGCKECKLRRVKCDQTHPVCIRCQRRGSICFSETPPSGWEVVIPAMISKPIAAPWMGEVNPEPKLLQYWLEKTSRILTLRPEDNPLSFPLLEHLVSTPSLLHAVQSISAGQEHFFDQSSLTTCLQQRGLALHALRRELGDMSNVAPPTLLAIFLQGISTPWTEKYTNDFGRDHLIAARHILENTLQDPTKRDDPLIQFILGWFLYWDSACAFLAAPNDLAPLNTELIYNAIQTTRTSFHPMIGFSAELLYLIACLGRHCRLVLDTGFRDPALEATLEEQLLAWNPEHDDHAVVDMSMAFRNHALIMLYNTCGMPAHNEGDITMEEASVPCKDAVRTLALDSLERLFRSPANSPCVQFHSIPLLTAACELRAADVESRAAAIQHFRAIYSATRVSMNIVAIEFIQELWDLHDFGVDMSWLELLDIKDWTLTFA
ncbi:fungal-specific transcription factor domain-containing protein [Plectosphaerella plurivora]|uniref:Fungal-specific transcription factor domain-containing protein n=1 Tax=Plectosphaerella plurivora TaxID=936078 RepID=A0A9P9A4U1_9PEZI|nr:fungal-specific transcription factor domain-containing protein [Plectosphaerella plurivora]